MTNFNKANAFDTKAAFLDLNLSIHNDIVSDVVCVSCFGVRVSVMFHFMFYLFISRFGFKSGICLCDCSSSC